MSVTVESLLAEHPELSDREIARQAGVTHPTVSKTRRRLGVPRAGGQVVRVTAPASPPLATLGDIMRAMYSLVRSGQLDVRGEALAARRPDLADSAAALMIVTLTEYRQALAPRVRETQPHQDHALSKAAQAQKGGSRR